MDLKSPDKPEKKKIRREPTKIAKFLYGVDLSEQEIESITNEQIKDYLIEKLMTNGNIQIHLETLKFYGWIEIQEEKKEVEYLSWTNTKETTIIDKIVDINILNDKKFKEYFVDNYKSQLDYNQILQGMTLQRIRGIVESSFLSRDSETSEGKKIVSTLREPKPPFFSYKSDVFDKFKENNPNKKLSELTALIADSWNNLDIEIRRNYEQNYEELLENYKQNWTQSMDQDRRIQKDEKGEFEYKNNDKKSKQGNKDMTEVAAFQQIKSPKIDKKLSFLANISGFIFDSKLKDTLEKVMPEEIIEMMNKIPNYYWEFHDSWHSALAFIKKTYRQHLGKYETYINDSKASGKWRIISRKFKATITDCKSLKLYSIPEEKLLLELKQQVKRMFKNKKYLIINISRERDFSPQPIRDVILFLPAKMEIDDGEVLSWEYRINSFYDRYGDVDMNG